MNAPGPDLTSTKQTSTGLTSTDTIDRLDALATELSARGWAASLRRTRGRPPCLHTRNPEPGAGALAEDIYALPGEDGQWAYWWPWNQRIASSAAGAAAAIVRALRSAGTA